MLGGLINGVFLVALCLSIFLEAIQRFVDPPKIARPQLVLIVGCCGLASNIIGLVLFSDGHAHGGHGHGHGHDHGHTHGASDEMAIAEEGGHPHDDETVDLLGDESGRVADVLPAAVIGEYQFGRSPVTRSKSGAAVVTAPKWEEALVTPPTSPFTTRNARKESVNRRGSNSESHPRHRRHTSGSRTRGFGSVDSIHVHPAALRREIIEFGRERLDDIHSTEGESEQEDEAAKDRPASPSERSRLLKHSHTNGSAKHDHPPSKPSHSAKKQDARHESWHVNHNHNKADPDQPKGGHSHADMNMRGVFIHVMGDFLGNIGVIVAALFIWLTNYSWRYYVDPGISLLITFIILYSAIPLCQSSARVLLQAAPFHINVDDIRDDILQLPGIINCHHLHVWQLTETRLVASLHIKVDCEVQGQSSAHYMTLAAEVRGCLHHYGIHSSTIQPEFCDPEGREIDEQTHSLGEGSSSSAAGHGSDQPKTSSKQPSRSESLRSQPGACMLECGDNCAAKSKCCPGPNTTQPGA